MPKQNEEKPFFQRAAAYFKGLSKKELIIWGCAAAAVVLLVVVSAALSGQGGTAAPSSVSQADIAPRGSSSSQTSSEGEKPAVTLDSHGDEIKAAAEKNTDTVGWLTIPGLSEIDKPIVQSTESNLYYLYRDAGGNQLTNNLTTGYHLLGAYYTHYRNTFGDREALSTNTVIFGHSDLGLNKEYKDDDPDGTLFSQLYRFLDEDFAKKTPYIYFSTPEEDMAFEVFAVYYTSAGTDYIEPEPLPTAYQKLLDNARSRSQYDYAVEVGPGDKILTLSTCTIHFGMAVKSDYRFVVMAKLVDTNDATKKQADLAVNEDIDPAYKG